MREIIFRGKRLDNGKWIYGDLVNANEMRTGARRVEIWVPQPDGELDTMNLEIGVVDPNTVGQFTGLYDKSGNKIFEGDILRFDDDDGIWQAAVVFERGLFGLDVYHPKQIKNPDGWSMKHDRVHSRWWGCRWGYEEFGTAFTYRQPLAIATVFHGSSEDYQNSAVQAWHKEHGHSKYVVWADIVGNVYGEPDLMKKQ